MNKSDRRSELSSAIVVTVYNEAHGIQKFLDSIKVQTVLPDEIIFVDGGSTDSTVSQIKENAALIKGTDVKIIECKQRINIAKGRNLGIADSKAEIIAVTDAGCYLDKYWFEEITSPFQKSDSLDVVSGWYVAEIVTSFQREFAALSIPELARVKSESFLPSSRSIAFRKTIWERVGGYPEFLTLSAEDTLFDIYLKRVGARFEFNKNAIVHWSPRDTIKKALWIQYSMGRGDGEGRIMTKVYFFYLLGIFFPPLLLLKYNPKVNILLFYIVKVSSVIGWLAGTLRYWIKIRKNKIKWEKERKL